MEAADILPSCLCSKGLSFRLDDVALSVQELFDHMVSSHIHSRKAGSIQAAADAISQLSEAYQDYVSKRPSTS